MDTFAPIPFLLGPILFWCMYVFFIFSRAYAYCAPKTDFPTPSWKNYFNQKVIIFLFSVFAIAWSIASYFLTFFLLDMFIQVKRYMLDWPSLGPLGTLMILVFFVTPFIAQFWTKSFGKNIVFWDAPMKFFKSTIILFTIQFPINIFLMATMDQVNFYDHNNNCIIRACHWISIK